MDLSTITKSLADIGDAAKTASTKSAAELAALTTEFGDYRTRTDAIILELQQKGNQRGAGGNASRGNPIFDFGKQIADDPKIAALRAGELHRANFTIPGNTRTLAKSVLVNAGTSGESPEFGYTSVPEIAVSSIVGGVQLRLALLQALTPIYIQAELAEVPRLSGESPNAAVQLNEGALKSESTMSFVNSPLRMFTVATYLNASKQVISDNPLLPQFLNTRLIYRVLQKFESLLINGAGGSDGITGLLHQGTMYAASSHQEADVVGEAIASLTSLGYSADIVLLNWFDFFRITSARDENGRYIGPGWASPQGNGLWGVKVIPTAALAAGTAIAFDSSQVAILSRSAAQVTIGLVNDQFTRNEITLLAECRGNLAVFDAHAVSVLSFATDSP